MSKDHPSEYGREGESSIANVGGVLDEPEALAGTFEVNHSFHGQPTGRIVGRLSWLVSNLEAEFLITTNHFELTPEQRMWVYDAFSAAIAELGEFVEDGLDGHQGSVTEDDFADEHPHQEALDNAVQAAVDALEEAAKKGAGKNFARLKESSDYMSRGSRTLDELAISLERDEKINILGSLNHQPKS